MLLENLLSATLLLAATAATAQNRHEYLLDSNWKFSKGDVPNAAKTDFADAKWQTVSIPHDWAIAGPFDGNNDLQVVKIEQNNEKAATQKSGRTGGLPFIGTGWYRRRLAVPGFGPGQRVVLLFDGAMSNAHVFVNGKSQGRQTKGPSDQPQTRYRLMWNDVKYAPGSIKVVAYDAQGKAVATEEIKTAGAPHHIKLVADRTALTADGKDLAYITARVEDAQGNLCPDAAQVLSFAVSGAGSFRAIGNGDPTSLESFQKPQMQAFQGQLVAIVQASDKAGAVQVKASSPGLQSGAVELSTRRAQ